MKVGLIILRLFLFLSVLLLVHRLLSSIDTHAQTSPCVGKKNGDADCVADTSGRQITIVDFQIWRNEFFGGCSSANLTATACAVDEDHDGSLMDANFDYPGSGTTTTDSIVTIADFEIWRKGYFATVTPTITVTVTPTIPPGTHTYIWVSPQEISTLPMSGLPWSAIKSLADSNLGVPNISDQDSYHPEKTYATALVAVRTDDSVYKTKAVSALMSAMGTENNPDPNCSDGTQLGARSMSLGRNLISYVVAADVLNFRRGGYDPNGDGAKFEDWVKSVRFRQNCPNNGGGPHDNLSQTHDGASSNGNEMAGASRIAAAAYLSDKAELDKAWATFRRYAGDKTVGPDLAYNSFAQTWAADLTAHVGINPKGSTKNGYRIDGVIPNDQGRGGDFVMPPGYTQYPWEGLQGAYAQALIFDRLGYKDQMEKNPWHVSDDALLRAVDYQWFLQQQYGGVWFDTQRAAWVKHLANKIYGKNYSVAPSAGARNIDFTQWTHQ